MLHAWHVDTQGEHVLSAAGSGGGEPCHVAVDPSGRLLVATNYTTSTISLQRLDPDGAFEGKPVLIRLSGSGPDRERQEDAHPHQVIFDGEVLVVVDLGADLVREFRIDLSGAKVAAEEMRRTQMPAGSGPRHAVLLPDRRMAVSGELGENLITGHRGQPLEEWTDVRSTRVMDPGRARWPRNYPGDIQRSVDGRYVYLANRSHNTVATFDMAEASPALVAELDTTVDWPQHMLVRPDCMLIAGWDSSRVVVAPLLNGIPQTAIPLFDCGAPGWLHAHRCS